MQVELNGTLKVIFAEKEVNDNLKKKEVVVTVDETTGYPQDIIAQAINNKIQLLDGYKMGDAVIIKCNLKGKSTNGKYYNQLNVYSIQKKS